MRARAQRVVLQTSRRLRRGDPGAAEPQQQGAPPACGAPFTSMYLDQFGNVRACCQNVDQTLGNVATATLTEIWHGSQVEELRAAMERHDYSLGCQFCAWQAEEGNEHLVFARTFDHLGTPDPSPSWPRQLELSMSNACNLQCVMCNGDWSSSIRTHRERRSPLPTVYHDAFFDELEQFLPHLDVVKVLGGEPFLSPESLRVLEMLVDRGLRPEVHVTTNGTQWSRRVERILESLPILVIVSLDGCTAATYESIRVGSDFDVVVGNLTKFQDYARTHGTGVNLAHCLMTANWQEFPDFLRFAEERQLSAYVNTVTAPVSMSLFHLPPSELARIVEFYEAHDDALSSELVLNRALWQDQLARLRRHLESTRAQGGHDEYLGVEGFVWRRVAPTGSAEIDATHTVLDDLGLDVEVATLELSVDGVVQAVREDTSDGTVLGVATSSLVGLPMQRLIEPFVELLGPATIGEDRGTASPDVQLRRIEFRDAGAILAGALTAQRGDEGVITAMGFSLGGCDAAVITHALEDVVASFRADAEGAEVVEISVDEEHRIDAIAPIRLLDVDLAELVGQHVGQLAGPFVERYGPITTERDVPTGTTLLTAARIREITCEPDEGPVLHVRSLSLPLHWQADDWGRSRILVSARLDG